MLLLLPLRVFLVKVMLVLSSLPVQNTVATRIQWISLFFALQKILNPVLANDDFDENYFKAPCFLILDLTFESSIVSTSRQLSPHLSASTLCKIINVTTIDQEDKLKLHTIKLLSLSNQLWHEIGWGYRVINSNCHFSNTFKMAKNSRNSQNPVIKTFVRCGHFGIWDSWDLHVNWKMALL